MEKVMKRLKPPAGAVWLRVELSTPGWLLSVSARYEMGSSCLEKGLLSKSRVHPPGKGSMPRRGVHPPGAAAPGSPERVRFPSWGCGGEGHPPLVPSAPVSPAPIRGIKGMWALCSSWRCLFSWLDERLQLQQRNLGKEILVPTARPRSMEGGPRAARGCSGGARGSS